MINEIDQEKLESMAKELAKNIKTEQNRVDRSRALLTMTVETALGAEMEARLGYGAHEAKGRNSGNGRNGYSKKVLKGDQGEVEIVTPTDRDSSVDPKIVRKGRQTRLTQFDDQMGRHRICALLHPLRCCRSSRNLLPDGMTGLRAPSGSDLRLNHQHRRQCHARSQADGEV